MRAPLPESSPAAEYPVAILAGGLATRLGPLTAAQPKALVEVAGEPFLAHQLRLLRAAGLERVVICAGHLGEMIRDRFGDGRRHGVRLEYSFDGPRLLGTGGALIRARPLLGGACFVLYGDSYLPIDYRAVGQAFRAAGTAGLMTVFENRDAYDRSNVWFADGRIRVYDKQHRLPAMRHIDYGLGVLRTEALDGWPEGEPVDLAAIYQRLIACGALAGHPVGERFYEIGSPAGLRDLERLLGAAPRPPA